MSTDQVPTRVRFFDGQYLQADDLGDEQTYHVQMRWRHNLALHSWGIVSGLDPRVEWADSDRARLVVDRGMAIDGYGRELVVTSVDPIPLNDFSKDATLDVWLYYRLSNPTGPPTSAAVCDGGATGDRLEERPEVVLRPTVESRSPDPSRPDEVPPGDLDFPPEGPLPDGPEQEWPVFLGRLSYREGAWAVDASLRRPAGLVAGRVVSPSRLSPGGVGAGGRTEVVNGGEPGLGRYTFAVMTVDDQAATDPDQNPPSIAVGEGDGRAPRIELAADRVRVAADMVFKDGAALEFQPNLINGGDHATLPAGAGNWRVYHHFEPPPKPTKDGKFTGGFSDELRVTLPAGPDGLNRVVVGCFTDKGKFTPILAVLDDRTVEVYGSLRVEGEIHGKVADVPDGARGAPAVVSPDALLDQLAVKLSAGDIEPAALLDRLVRTTGVWPALAQAIAKDPRPSTVIEPLTAALWNATTSPPRSEIGSQATGDEMKFLDFLDSLPVTGGASVAPQIGFFGDWAFDSVTPPRAGLLAGTVPKDSKNKGLVAFAAELVKSPNADRLKALIQALIDASAARTAEALAAVTAAELKSLLTALAPLSVNPLVDALGGLSGAPRGEALKAAGRLFPRDAADAAKLADGLLDSGNDRAVQLLKMLLDGDDGRDAVTAALKEKPPTSWPPALVNIPNDAPLRLLFKRVKDNGDTVPVPDPLGGVVQKPFKDVINVLGSKIDSL